MSFTMLARIVAALAALFGAAGIAAAALAAHGGYDENLRIASQFALIHAALLVTLCFNPSLSRTAILAATALLAGTALFSGDLALRALAGHALFPMAAPTGGTLLIAGWILLALAAAISAGKKPS